MINAALSQAIRLDAGRITEPSAAILDSQRVKTTSAEAEREYNGGKQVKESKRHIIVDTLGLLLLVSVTATSVQHSHAEQSMLIALPHTGS